MKLQAAALAVALIAEAGCATMSGRPPPMPVSSMVDCSHFAASPEGNWRVVQTTKLGQTTLTAGAPVTYGVIVNGVDLTVILAGKCAQPHA